MNAVPSTSSATPAQRLAYTWGWSRPGPDVLSLAERASRLLASPLDQAAALAAFDVLDAQAIDRLVARCPAGTQLLDWALQHESVQVAPRIDALRATLQRLAYYPSLAVLSHHPALASTPALVARCESLSCILLQTDDRPVLVFAQLKALHHYRALGRAERAQCAIVAAVEGDSLEYAIGDHDEIHALIQRYRQTDAAAEAETVAVWNAQSADTGNLEEGRHLQRLIDYAVSSGATDIKIAQTPNGAPEIAIRRNGRLIVPKIGALASRALTGRMIQLLESKSGANPDAGAYKTPKNGHLRYRSQVGEVVMRLSFIPLNHLGQTVPLKSVSIRIFTFRDKPVRLSGLQLQPKVLAAVTHAVEQRQGLILVVGPTNSGKSTTIAGALSLHREIHGDALKRLTVEDPVERIIPGAIQFQVPPKAVNDQGETLSKTDRLTNLLHAALRHDPDAVFIGEIPGSEMAELCVSFAASGHLALSTLHANNAMLAFERLRNMLSADMSYQLSESLLVIVGQRLVPTVCKKCAVVSPTTKAERDSWKAYLDDLGIAPIKPKRSRAKKTEATSAESEAAPVAVDDSLALPSTLIHPSAEGCSECDAGYDGVVPINEVLPFTRAVRDAACAFVAGQNARAAIGEGRTVSFAETAHVLLVESRVALRDVLTLGR